MANKYRSVREYKHAPVKLESVDCAGKFTGYASIFGKPDMGNDVIVRGAFTKTLKKRGPSQIRMLFQHNPDEPIGIWTHVIEDQKGLLVTGKISDTSTRGRELISLMHEGAIDGLSIGFRTVRSRKSAADNIRNILEAELWEISIVTFPMQQEARISSCKNMQAGNSLPTTRQFENWLTRDVGLTRNQAKIVISKGFTSLNGMREAAFPQTQALAAKIRQASQLLGTNQHTGRS